MSKTQSLSLWIAGLLLLSTQAQSQVLSDSELKAKIEAANPGISAHDRNVILSCHKYSQVCRELDTEFKGLRPAQLTAYLKKNRDFFEAQAREYDLGIRSIPPLPPQTNAAPRKPIDPNAPKISSHFLVRRSLEDISTLSQPKDVRDVTGAQFSYSRDNEPPNTNWTARGIVAVPFYITQPYDSNDRYAIRNSYAIAPLIAFDRVTNSATSQIKNNLNNLKFGLISESAIANVGVENPASYYFRFNAGANTSFEGRFKSAYARAEFEPVSTSLGLNAPLDFLSATGFNISPLIKARAEYLSQAGSSIEQPIFASRSDAFRIGALAGVEIQPVLLWANWLSSFRLVATYSYFYDTLSHRSYSLFDSALNYNIDADGNFALSASYRTGRLEETGEKIDQYMLGLAVKFNELP